MLWLCEVHMACRSVGRNNRQFCKLVQFLSEKIRKHMKVQSPSYSWRMKKLPICRKIDVHWANFGLNNYGRLPAMCSVNVSRERLRSGIRFLSWAKGLVIPLPPTPALSSSPLRELKRISFLFQIHLPFNRKKKVLENCGFVCLVLVLCWLGFVFKFSFK